MENVSSSAFDATFLSFGTVENLTLLQETSMIALQWEPTLKSEERMVILASW